MNQLSLAWNQIGSVFLKQEVGYRVGQGFHFRFVSDTVGGREAMGCGTLISST